MSRRILAICMPQLACELVRQTALDLSHAKRCPLAVILTPRNGNEIGSDTIFVVDENARRYGVRPGQKPAEALVLASHLSIVRKSKRELDAALGRVAEIALHYGAPASVRLSNGDDAASYEEQPELASPKSEAEAPYDTVWVDVSGTAHLFGGEEALIDELKEKIEALGHWAKFAIAPGPRIAQALARWGHLVSSKDRYPIVYEGEIKESLAPLPVEALLLDVEKCKFLMKVGLFSIGQVAELPRAPLSARLGSSARAFLAFIAGDDPTPLLPYQAPLKLNEVLSFEEAVQNTQSLLFVLRGMCSRMLVRLTARGLACLRVRLLLSYEVSIFRCERGSEEPPWFEWIVSLPTAISGEADLFRVLRAKVESLVLLAPVAGVELELSEITRIQATQIDLSRDKIADPNAWGSLLGELSAEYGAESVGVLTVMDSHLPERQSKLIPVRRGPTMPSAAKPRESNMPEPTRLLREPTALSSLSVGALVEVEGRVYVIERLSFEKRLSAVYWWTKSPASRDYARAWLVSGMQSRPARSTFVCGEARVFVDRETGNAFLEGWFE